MFKKSFKENKTLKQRSFCVYCRDEEVNDATFRYLEMLRGGLRDAGIRDLGITQDKTILRQATIVVTISCLPAMRAMTLHPRAKIFHWFQGIEAVERRFLHKGWRALGRWLLWTIMERIILRHARVKLFVSQQMRRFLKDLERPGQVSLVIPCYNVDIGDIAASDPLRYSQINLVYAGSMYPWQCVVESLQAYRAVLARRAQAQMTIITREVSCAKALCKKLDMEEVKVEAVAPENMVERLKNFSYGFILRDDMPINEVSTPTKFSSYLGAGVIPIMTKATPALSAMAANTIFQITVDAPSNAEEIAEGILNISDSTPDPKNVERSFTTIFEIYFNDILNRDKIASAAIGI